MTEDGAGSGSPRQVQSVSRAWWRTRWFYLLSQGGIGILLIPLFGAFVYPNLPYLIMLLALATGLLVPFALFPRLSANADNKTIAPRERERTVREDLKGNKTLLRQEEEKRTWSLLFGADPAVRGKRQKRSFGLTSDDIPSLLVVLWSIPLFALALSAPCRALMLLLHEALHELPAGMAITYPFEGLFGFTPRPEHLDIMGGTCGILLGLAAAFSVGSWQLRTARQVKNIPTATARSAAPGLAEFRGTARGKTTILHFSSGDTPESTTQSLAPFDLEDETGTIRVDPRGAVIRSFWSLQFLQRMGGSVVLTKRVVPRTYGGKEVRELKDGDPVYVLGSVEKDAEAAADATDSARLVVRRSGRQVPTSFFYRLLKVDRSPEQFSYLDVFFISDSTEQRAYDWVLADLRKTAVIAAVWVALSSWLLAQGGKAVQLW